MEFRYKTLRENRGLTQEELAKKLNLKRNTYSKWELLINDMPLGICNKLANFYNVSVDYLLGLVSTRQYDNHKEEFNIDILKQRLKKIRKKMKLTQKDVAKVINIKQASYNDYESGKVIISTFGIINIASFYHCSVDYLLGRIDDSMMEDEPQQVVEETKTTSNSVRFKELRKQNKLRQVDIAKILNVNKQAYYQYEKLITDISLDNCNRLANYYHVSIDYLLGLSNTIQYVDSINDIDLNIMRGRLKELRKKYHLKQAELCDKIGFAQTTYSSFERGIYIPTTFKLLDIISYYHVSMDYILGKTNTNYLGKEEN